MKLLEKAGADIDPSSAAIGPRQRLEFDGHSENLEHETGLEPATLSLGKRTGRKQ